MTEYHIFKRLPGFLYELLELVGVVDSAKKYFWSGFNVKCVNFEVNRAIRGLEMAVFEPKIVFLGLLDTLCMFICCQNSLFRLCSWRAFVWYQNGVSTTLRSHFIAKFGFSG